MKLKSIKNIVVLTGFLVLDGCSTQELTAKPLSPATDAEEIIIDGFCKEIPENDQRSFNHIIDQIISLIKYNHDYFKHMVQGKVTDANAYIHEFMRMLQGLKAKTNAMAIVNELNKHKATFDTLMPRAMGELLRVPLKTLQNLKTRLKRN